MHVWLEERNTENTILFPVKCFVELFSVSVSIVTSAQYKITHVLADVKKSDVRAFGSSFFVIVFFQKANPDLFPFFLKDSEDPPIIAVKLPRFKIKSR